MDWFWRWLSIIIIILLLVRCEIEASVYKAEENRIKVDVPSFLVTPIVWIDKRIGDELTWGYNLPWDEDYDWVWHLKSGKPVVEEEDKKASK